MDVIGNAKYAGFAFPLYVKGANNAPYFCL